MTIDIYADLNTFLLSIFPRTWLLTMQVAIGLFLMALFVPLRAWSPRFKLGDRSMERCPADRSTLRLGLFALGCSGFIGFAMVFDAMFSPAAPRGPTMLMALVFAMIQTRGAYTAWRTHILQRTIGPLPPYEAHALPPP